MIRYYSVSHYNKYMLELTNAKFKTDKNQYPNQASRLKVAEPGQHASRYNCKTPGCLRTDVPPY